MKLRTMASETMLIAVDGHLHWYPHYQIDVAFGSLVRNLGTLPREMQNDPQNLFKMAFLVEPAGCRFFEQLLEGSIDCSPLNVSIVPASDGLSLTFIQQGISRLCLIAGKQIVAREKIEVLGITVGQTIPDNLPARDVIDRIVEVGGIPVLPWAPGKWFFNRGKLVKELIDNSSSRQLVISDTSLRPTLWPMPRLMRHARKNGLIIIAGSDPLPIPGEETQMGAYGFLYQGPFDTEQPVASVRRMLTGSQDAFISAGRRNSVLQVIHRLKRLRNAKDNEH